MPAGDAGIVLPLLILKLRGEVSRCTAFWDSC